MVTEQGDNNRPYAPPSNVISVLHRLQARNLPERIDAEYLRDASIPEGTLGRTLFGLRFLGLVGDGGEPTQALRSIHTATDEEYRSILGGLVREAYSDVFNVVDPGEDTQDRIVNVFRRFAPASQRSRMVIFFLGMCREAGIPTLDTPRQRAMSSPSTRQAPRPATARTTPATVPDGRRRGGGYSPPPPLPPTVPPALEGLLRSLPAPGKPLSAARRKQWLVMAEATLAFVYPEMGDGSDNEDSKGGEA
jgi:hypothetical protein